MASSMSKRKKGLLIAGALGLLFLIPKGSDKEKEISTGGTFGGGGNGGFQDVSKVGLPSGAGSVEGGTATKKDVQILKQQTLTAEGIPAETYSVSFDGGGVPTGNGQVLTKKQAFESRVSTLEKSYPATAGLVRQAVKSYSAKKTRRQPVRSFFRRRRN